MNAVARLISRITGREEGQTLTEYGLLLFFIAVVAIVAIVFLGEQISTLFSNIATSLS
ncbi:MAG: Flp family type IVb pilin [Candidatus Eisenbacteria bacterium]